MKVLAWLSVVLAVLLVGGCGYLGLSGSVIVYDHTGEVVSAALTNEAAHFRRPLWRLPGGRFFGIPDFDGVIEVRCRDGSIAETGYVTGGLHTSATVVSGKPCRVVENM